MRSSFALASIFAMALAASHASADECKKVDSGNIKADTQETLECNKSNVHAWSCLSKGWAYNATFVLSPNDDSNTYPFGTIQEIILTNKNYGKATKDQLKVYEFDSEGTKFAYSLDGFKSCTVKSSDSNAFGKFNNEGVYVADSK